MGAVCSSEAVVTFHHFAYTPNDCSLKLQKLISHLLNKQNIIMKGYKTGLATFI
jgi:hypothetical protein